MSYELFNHIIAMIMLMFSEKVIRLEILEYMSILLIFLMCGHSLLAYLFSKVDDGLNKTLFTNTNKENPKFKNQTTRKLHFLSKGQ